MGVLPKYRIIYGFTDYLRVYGVGRLYRVVLMYQANHQTAAEKCS